MFNSDRTSHLNTWVPPGHQENETTVAEAPSPEKLFHPIVPVVQLKVWVLVPTVDNPDPALAYYYDFSQSLAEYTRVFDALHLPWVWQPVTMVNYASIAEAIVKEREEGVHVPVVLNLCDGDELNGAPGISVLRALEHHELIYTGASEFFYIITTSKITMKEAFGKAGVPSPAWEPILSPELDAAALLQRLGSPLILKPAVSAGSLGVGVKNVVENEQELLAQTRKMFEGYRGWDLSAEGCIAESFVVGPEYTVLIVGTFDHPEHAIVYPPVERVFHASLPDRERFLSFDRLWELYEDESPMPGNENFYEYASAAEGIRQEVEKVAWDAFAAVKGTGYTRVDIRVDSGTGKVYVLEVNAQCGLSEDEDFTSTGAILRLSGNTFAGMVVHIINDAFIRRINS